MPVTRLMRIVDTNDSIKDKVRWKDPGSTVDTLERIIQVYEVVADLLLKLLQRQTLHQLSQTNQTVTQSLTRSVPSHCYIYQASYSP